MISMDKQYTCETVRVLATDLPGQFPVAVAIMREGCIPELKLLRADDDAEGSLSHLGSCQSMRRGSTSIR